MVSSFRPQTTSGLLDIDDVPYDVSVITIRGCSDIFGSRVVLASIRNPNFRFKIRLFSRVLNFHDLKFCEVKGHAKVFIYRDTMCKISNTRSLMATNVPVVLHSRTTGGAKFKGLTSQKYSLPYRGNSNVRTALGIALQTLFSNVTRSS